MRFKSILHVFAAAMLVLSILGCTSAGQNGITSELLKPVEVSLSGKVQAADTGLPLAGMLVRVLRFNPADETSAFLQDGSADASATTSVDGSFSFAKVLSLDVDSYQHYLHVSDPVGDWFDNDATVIYAMRDGALAYNDLKLYAKAPTSYTIVSGTVKDLLAETAVSGLGVRLYRKGESAAAFQATTDGSGIFSIPSVPVTLYRLELDGSALTPDAYIKEDAEIVLANSATNPLGDLLVSKASTGDDLRIVLSWTDSGLDLNSSFSLPRPDFDFNHLGTKQVELPSPLISVNPAFKFAEGTAYWPENMGGAADQANRVAVNRLNMTHAVSAQTVVELDKDSATGAVPEVTTIHKMNPLANYPPNLAYHYAFTKAGTSYDYYPIGMGVYNVTCSTPDTPEKKASIYDSGATVKIYQGSTYLGKFSVADLSIDSGESNRRYWPVLQVEIGYLNPNPSTVDHIYYRVVPYGSAGALPDSRFAGFFYQETRLPGNETFAAALDQESYGRDYLFSPTPVLDRVLVSESGRLYAYSGAAGAKAWSRRAAMDISRPYTAAFYWMSTTGSTNTLPEADRLYLGREVLLTTGFPLLSASGVSELGLVGDVSVESGTGVLRINDYGMVNFRDSQGKDYRFLLLATEKGPRGASSIMMPGDQQVAPKLDGFNPGWYDGTTGQVLSTGAGRVLTKVLPARDRNGALLGYALVGGAGLFLFNASNAVYDSTVVTVADRWITGSGQRASFSNLANTSGTIIDLSDSNNIVTAMTEFPTLGQRHFFIVAVYEVSTSSNKLYKIELNEEGAALDEMMMPVTEFIGALNAPGDRINDLLFVRVDRAWVLLAATDSGLRVAHNWQSATWSPYLPDMLDGFKIKRLIDYDGKLGILAEGNGLICGPYPQ